MEVTEQGVVPPSSMIIRGEGFVRSSAIYARDRAGSAEMRISEVLTVVDGWVSSGNKILTPERVELVMMPSLSKLDGFVYPKKGGPVFKELQRHRTWKHFRLQDPPMSFKEDGKRTMNRFIEKADGEITEILDIRLLSMVFWIGVAQTIEEYQGQ
ncbi:MAG: hypothetical protein AAFU49_12895 [Pseudomonadota bacterium]